MNITIPLQYPRVHLLNWESESVEIQYIPPLHKSPSSLSRMFAKAAVSKNLQLLRLKTSYANICAIL